MSIERYVMSSKTIDIAESDNYIDLTNRLCYYDATNLNDVVLPYEGVEETAREQAASLVHMPLQAKIKKVKGEDDFGGHEMSVDKSGHAVFNTQSIGTHIKAWIGEPEDVVTVSGEIKKLPCLYATARVWKRYPRVVATIKKLFNSPKGLNSSWEISTTSYEYANGVKKLTDYEFIGNTCLGSNVTPAYAGTSKTISIATAECDAEFMIAEALSQDLIENNTNEEVGTEMNKENNTQVVEEPVISTSTPEETPVAETNVEPTGEAVVNAVENPVAETSEGKPETEPTTETAQLTEWDLRKKVRKACQTKLGKYCWIAYMFPVEQEVWCGYDDADSELAHVKFTFEVENDEVKVSEPEYVTLTVSIRNINTTVAELQKDIDTLKAELEIKNDAITKASETIQGLNVQISELTPFKEQVELAEQERIEAEIAEEKEQLKQKMLKGNLFTEEEIAEAQIKDLIEARDVSAINNLIADRFVASLDVTEKPEAAEGANVAETTVVATANIETSEAETETAYSFMGKLFAR